LTERAPIDADLAGAVLVNEISLERLQLIAAALAKSIVLPHYETRVELL
jgi:uncharacterized Rmd1/YagE family protein